MPTDFKNIPAFETEEDERTFWATHDSTEYLNWDDAEAVVQTKTFHENHLRLPEIMLNELPLPTSAMFHIKR